MLLNGVRSSVTGGQRGGGSKGVAGRDAVDAVTGERTMAVSLRESVQQVSDPRNLDASVEEVFRLMLGLECERVTATAVFPSDTVTAVVGLGGVLSGACVFKSGAETAMKIAAGMTGMEFSAIDDTVKDGIGEICNMVAGAWKGKDSARTFPMRRLNPPSGRTCAASTSSFSVLPTTNWVTSSPKPNTTTSRRGSSTGRRAGTARSTPLGRTSPARSRGRSSG